MALAASVNAMDGTVPDARSGVRSSTEFLERGAMVGSGQYSLGAAEGAATGANMVPPPTPLVLQPQPPSPPAMPSPDAHSPGPFGSTAAELRAMANALEESHDLGAADFPNDSPGADGFDGAEAYTERSSGGTDGGDRGKAVSSVAIVVPTAGRSRPVATSGGVAVVAGSPRPHSWLEAVYSPKVDTSVSSPDTLAGAAARSPSASPGRGSLRSSPKGSRADLVSGFSPGAGAAAAAAARPTTPLHAVYGLPPTTAPAAAPAAPANLTGGLGSAAGAAGTPAAVRTSGGLGTGRQAWSTASQGSEPAQRHPGRQFLDGSAEESSAPAAHADPQPHAAPPSLSPPQPQPQPPSGGSAPINASPRPRPGSSAAGAASPHAPPRGSAKSLSSSPMASPVSSSPLGPAGGLLAASVAAGGAAVLLSPRSYALEPLPAQHGSRREPSAASGPSQPHEPARASVHATEAGRQGTEAGTRASAPGGAADRAPSARGGSGGAGSGPGGGSRASRAGLQGAAVAAGSGGSAAGQAGRRQAGGARGRRQELFEEEDPAVVLEQSIALLSEVEGLIRGSVSLPSDQPLGAISPEIANRIPGELLEALEDTLEVIAMSREELAKREERERGSRPPSHQAPHPPSASRRFSGTGNASSGGGGGALQAYYSSHRNGGFGERSSSSGHGGCGGGGGAARNSSAGRGLGGGSPHHPQLPPIAHGGGSSRGGVGLQGSPAALGRPPSQSPGLHRPPSQQSLNQLHASPTQPGQHPPPHQAPQRSGSATRRGAGSPFGGAGGAGGGGAAAAAPPPVASSVLSAGSGGAPGSARRGRAREGAPEDWMGRKQQHAEAERRKREAQLASDLRFLQQIRQRSAEAQQQHEALLAASEESLRAARVAKAASEAQHRWLQYQDSIAEAAKRQQDTILLTGPTARLQLS